LKKGFVMLYLYIMTKPEDARRLPVITTMPVIQSSVIDDIKNTERQTGVTDYLWT